MSQKRNKQMKYKHEEKPLENNLVAFSLYYKCHNSKVLTPKPKRSKINI